MKNSSSATFIFLVPWSLSLKGKYICILIVQLFNEYAPYSIPPEGTSMYDFSLPYVQASSYEYNVNQN